jgi:hypothetical protein
MRIICLILTLLCLLFVACSSKTEQPAITATSPADRYVESVNTVSGGFSVDADLASDKKPFTISPTQAYARLLKNAQDQTKNEVLIVLTEKPLSRYGLAVVENEDATLAANDLDKMLQGRGARGVKFRVPLNQPNVEIQVRPFFDGGDFHFGNLIVQTKMLTADNVDGEIKGDVASQQSNIVFSVKVQAEGWTGGTFYQQPPTNLARGQASGQISIDDRTVTFNHAYARLIELDLFDENQNVFKVWLTEKPVDAKFLVDDSPGNLVAMKQSGNGLVFTYRTNGPAGRSEPTVWLVGDLRDDTGNSQLRQLLDLFDQIGGIERDYVRHNANAIEGRLYSAFPVEQQDRTYRVDLLFNAAILPPAVSDGPVTANNGGTALAADGGAPAKAYLGVMERMKAAKDVDQKITVWLSAVPAAEAEKMKSDMESVPPEQREVLVEVFAPLENSRLVSGFVKDNKATLRFEGTGRDGKATEVVNMHLENREWKIGRREIREEE